LWWRYWLGRLSFSFLIGAVVLEWEGFKLLGEGVEGDMKMRAFGYIAGGVVLFGLALAGARIRYRRD
jgi:hypothetical protein